MVQPVYQKIHIVKLLFHGIQHSFLCPLICCILV